jgi:putative hydrolase of the HAD superfamily
MKPGAVLFDYGHTLIDFDRPEPELIAAYHNINERLEHELERQLPQASDLFRAVSVKVDEEIGKSYESGSEQEVDIADLYNVALAAIGVELPLETVRWIMQQEQDAWNHGIKVGGDVPEVLTELRTRGIRVGLVSNAAYDPEMMRGQMRYLGLLDYFDGTIFSSDIGIRKPNRAIYEKALTQVGTSARKSIFVGDRLREDVRGPRALGMTAFLTHEFRQEQPDDGEEVTIISRLTDLSELLQ